MQPENFESAPLEITDVAPAREPFWNYVDLALFIGAGFALLILLVLPVILVAQFSTALKNSFAFLGLASQAALYLAIYLALKIILYFRYSKSVFGPLGWRPSSFHLAYAPLLGMGLTVVMGLFLKVVQAPKVPSFVDDLITSRFTLVLLCVMAALAAPVFEELLFRGFLQPLLSRTFGIAAGILLTALVFGGLHLKEYGNHWQYGAAITLVGVVFGYVRFRSGSLIPSTIMHACYNGVAVVALVVEKYPKLK